MTTSGLSFSEASLYNYKGKGTKRARAELLLNQVVLEAVKVNRFTRKASSKDVQAAIKQWLQHAPERSGEHMTVTQA